MATPGTSWVFVQGLGVFSQDIGWWENLEKVGGRGYTDIVGVRNIGGCTYRGKERSDHLFHAVIPTVAHVEEPDDPSITYRPHLISVAVQFSTPDHEAFVDRVTTWDRSLSLFDTGSGPDQRLRLDGDFTNRWQVDGEGGNVFTVRERPIVWGGIGISVYVHFEREANIFFTLFGARLQYERHG